MLVFSGKILDQLFQLAIRLCRTTETETKTAMLGISGLAAFSLGKVQLLS